MREATYSIERTSEGKTILQVEENGEILYVDFQPGVENLTPEAVAGRRTFRKVFTRKKIFLPDELAAAKAAHLARTPSTIVLGMNGYSSLKPEQLKAWGVQPGAYEVLCQEILSQTIRRLRREFNGVNVILVHGASDMGVDKAVMESAKEMNCPQLGFNCLQFLFYVVDDDQPVYVAKTQPEYSDAFVSSLDVLIAANGRLQAYQMDIAAVFTHRKRLIPINILRLISSTGGPPAEDGNGKIEDAVAFFEQRVFSVSQHLDSPHPFDEVPSVIRLTGDVLTKMGRQILPPEHGLRIGRT